MEYDTKLLSLMLAFSESESYASRTLTGITLF